MKLFTEKQIEFLSRGYPLMWIPELTIAFNKEFGTARTENQVHTALKNHKIHCGRRIGNPVGTLIAWTQEQAEFMCGGYRRLTVPELTIALNAHFSINKKASQVESFLNNRRILSGRTGCFEKGLTPWNKGTKGICKPNSGNFKKGHIPPNRKPVGTERVDTQDGHLLIKTSQQNPYTGFPARYRSKHVVMWEEVNGPVPPGMCVFFKDGDNGHCVIENFMLITRAELLALNQHNYKETPNELKPSVLAMIKLEVKLKTRFSKAAGGRRKRMEIMYGH